MSQRQQARPHLENHMALSSKKKKMWSAAHSSMTSCAVGERERDERERRERDREKGHRFFLTELT